LISTALSFPRRGRTHSYAHLRCRLRANARRRWRTPCALV
jgi:hypothetical protein